MDKHSWNTFIQLFPMNNNTPDVQIVEDTSEHLEKYTLNILAYLVLQLSV